MTENAHPWRKRQEIPDPQVRDAADQYEAARKLLAIQPPGSGVFLPLMNTAAVAIELYLKSLSAEVIHTPVDDFPGLYRVTSAPARKGSRGHELRALFDELSADLQEDVARRFNVAFPDAASLGFRTVLEQCEGAFLVSRYPFEQGVDLSAYPLGALLRCSEFLAKYAAELPPRERIEWK